MRNPVRKKSEAVAKIAAQRSMKVAKLVKSSFKAYEKIEEFIPLLNKRASLAVKFLTNRYDSQYTVGNLKKVYARLKTTVKEIDKELKTASDKLEVSYLCSIKSSADKKASAASKELISGLNSMYSELAEHKASFSLLAKKVAFEVSSSEGVTDEEFLEIDENGYVEEPVEPINELEEFNKTFVEETASEEDLDDESILDEDEKEASEETEEDLDDESILDEIEESEKEASEEDLDDESILDEIEEESEKEASEEDLDDESILDESEEDLEEYTSSKKSQSKKAGKTPIKKLAKFNSSEKSDGEQKLSNDEGMVFNYLRARF